MIRQEPAFSELRIVSGESLVDIRRDRTIDIALRYGPGCHGAGVHAERLWPTGAIIAVCAPEVARDPALRSPVDLHRQILLRTAPPDSGWQTWLAAASVPVGGAMRKALEGPVFGTSQLAIEAAASGRGIALAPAVLVERDIATGRLVRLFSTSLADPNAFWLLCRADRAREARLRAFTKWVRQEAARTEAAVS